MEFSFCRSPAPPPDMEHKMAWHLLCIQNKQDKAEDKAAASN